MHLAAGIVRVAGNTWNVGTELLSAEMSKVWSVNVSMWTLTERDAITKMLASDHDHIRTALLKFLETRVQQCARDCAQTMRTSPPDVYLAVRYGSQADVYDSLLADLARECEKETA